MKKGEAKIGTAVKVTNLDYMVGVAISSQMNEIRKVGVYGVITAFVPGYNRNVCLVRQIGFSKSWHVFIHRAQTYKHPNRFNRRIKIILKSSNRSAGKVLRSFYLLDLLIQTQILAISRQ